MPTTRSRPSAAIATRPRPERGDRGAAPRTPARSSTRPSSRRSRRISRASASSPRQELAEVVVLRRSRRLRPWSLAFPVAARARLSGSCSAAGSSQLARDPPARAVAVPRCDRAPARRLPGGGPAVDDGRDGGVGALGRVVRSARRRRGAQPTSSPACRWSPSGMCLNLVAILANRGTMPVALRGDATTRGARTSCTRTRPRCPTRASRGSSTAGRLPTGSPSRTCSRSATSSSRVGAFVHRARRDGRAAADALTPDASPESLASRLAVRVVREPVGSRSRAPSSRSTASSRRRCGSVDR